MIFFCHKFDSQIICAKKPVTWVCQVISTYLTEEKNGPMKKKIKIGSTYYYLGQITINLSPDLLKFKSIHCEHYLMHEKTEKMNWGTYRYIKSEKSSILGRIKSIFFEFFSIGTVPKMLILANMYISTFLYGAIFPFLAWTCFSFNIFKQNLSFFDHFLEKSVNAVLFRF